MDSLSLFDIFIVIVVVFMIERRFRVLEQQNSKSIYMLNALLKHLEVKYPSAIQLSEKVILLRDSGKFEEACDVIMDEFGCSYAEAERVLKNWDRDIKEG